MKGISEIFSSLMVLLITLSLLVPLLVYSHQFFTVASNSLSKKYRDFVLLSEIKLEIIKLGQSTNDWYLYDVSPYPLQIEEVILNGQSYTVDKVIEPGQLVNFATFTGVSQTIPIDTPVYMFINGTMISYT